MDTEDLMLVLLFFSLLVFTFICLLFPIVLAMLLSVGYFIIIAMFGFLCGLASGTRIFAQLTIFVYRPYDPAMSPLHHRIRKFFVRKIEKIIVLLLITSSVFSILIEFSYYGISFLPFNFLKYGVFISNLVLASNIVIMERVLFEEGNWEIKLFLYILAITLFSYGILTFSHGIREPIYPPDVYPEMYQLQKYFPSLCLSIFNIAASCGFSLTLIDAYCDIF
ncbi:MAG: hypothetical protein PVF58_11985 [Candidatus Methanofastidiosia archaeon]|jgi:hypothetical protein